MNETYRHVYIYTHHCTLNNQIDKSFSQPPSSLSSKCYTIANYSVTITSNTGVVVAITIPGTHMSLSGINGHVFNATLIANTDCGISSDEANAGNNQSQRLFLQLISTTMSSSMYIKCLT